MKPRFYVHMGPKATEKVSCIWKAAHIILSILLLGSSGTATVAMYNILEMYNFNCVLYARIAFEKTHSERYNISATTTSQTNANESNATETNTSEPNATETLTASSVIQAFEELDCSQDPLPVECQTVLRRILELQQNDNSNEESFEHELDSEWKKWKKAALNARQSRNLVYGTSVNKTGFINMRRTAFATTYMCNLMFFAPLASVVATIFIGALVGVGGKGGAGNPGDVLPNPWICVYPFLGLCVFMMTISFVSNSLFQNGLQSFCKNYVKYTNIKVCSEDIDQFTVQFTKDQMGSPKPFYFNYVVGHYGTQITASLWVMQTLVYLFRIMFLADFSLYLTRIQLKSDKDAKMANVVLSAMDAKSKLV